jgi:hypothetical protein
VEELLEKWPHYIKQGFEMVHGVEVQDEWIEAFAARWGGLTQEAIEQAFLKGSRDDRLIALCVLGYSPFPQASSLLVPLLYSSSPEERWLSALCLGERKDERTWPILETMLTEFLPTAEAPIPIEHQYWFDSKRMWVASLLFDLDDPLIVPLFRRAFLLSVRAERFLSSPVSLDYGRMFQNHVMHLLGKRGALGVLVGLDILSTYLQTAVVNLALGSCHYEERFPPFGGMIPPGAGTRFHKEINAVLTERFGLTEEEQELFLTTYRLHRYSHIRW